MYVYDQRGNGHAPSHQHHQPLRLARIAPQRFQYRNDLSAEQLQRISHLLLYFARALSLAPAHSRPWGPTHLLLTPQQIQLSQQIHRRTLPPHPRPPLWHLPTLPLPTPAPEPPTRLSDAPRAQQVHGDGPVAQHIVDRHEDLHLARGERRGQAGGRGHRGRVGGGMSTVWCTRCGSAERLRSKTRARMRDAKEKS
jgi:hypothetical protein